MARTTDRIWVLCYCVTSNRLVPSWMVNRGLKYCTKSHSYEEIKNIADKENLTR